MKEGRYLQSYCKSRSLGYNLRPLALLQRTDSAGGGRCLLLVVVACLKGEWERVFSVIFAACGVAETVGPMRKAWLGGSLLRA